MIGLTDGDYDLLRELERDARPGPSAYTPDDADYEEWARQLDMTLPPLAPEPPAADTTPDPEAEPW
jgi:hypothetical protein